MLFNSMEVSSMKVSEMLSSIKCYTFYKGMSNVLWSSPSSVFLFLVFDDHAIQGKIKRKKMGSKVHNKNGR